MGRFPLILAAVVLASPAVAQNAGDGPARTDAMQIETGRGVSAGGKAYLPATPAPAQERLPAASAQIASSLESGPAVAQLSRAELDATLAQLTDTERRVLFQAIEGTDICDNPPQVAAVIALCRDRLETRFSEFADAPRSFSAEETLIRSDLAAAHPALTQVIERLARGSAAAEDFGNQAIASIALSTPASSGGKEEEKTSTLAEETQALVNAIINQLQGAPR